MSIADKILRAKTDYDEVYDAGYEAGKAEGGGGDGGLDEFSDAWQNNGNRISYREAFSETSFTHISPKYPIKPKNADSMFANSRILETVEWDKFDLSETGSLYNAFGYCGKLKTVDTDLAVNSTGATILNSIFRECKALERVKSLTIYPEAALKNSFDGCENLVDITIVGTIGQNVDFGACKNLSKDSLMYIRWALSTTAVGKTLTVSQEAIDKAFADDPLGWYQIEYDLPNWSFVYK